MFLPSGSEAKTSIWKTEGQKETRKERNGENKNREKRKTNDLDIMNWLIQNTSTTTNKTIKHNITE